MSDTTPPAMMPADWYIDPSDPSQERYWDGATWTEQVRLVAAPATAAASAPARPTTTSNRFSIAGIFFGVLAFLIFPIIFGPIGFFLGAVGKSRGESNAKTAIVVSDIGMVAGVLIGVVLGLATT